MVGCVLVLLLLLLQICMFAEPSLGGNKSATVATTTVSTNFPSPSSSVITQATPSTSSPSPSTSTTTSPSERIAVNLRVYTGSTSCDLEHQLNTVELFSLVQTDVCLPSNYTSSVGGKQALFFYLLHLDSENEVSLLLFNKSTCAQSENIFAVSSGLNKCVQPQTIHKSINVPVSIYVTVPENDKDEGKVCSVHQSNNIKDYVAISLGANCNQSSEHIALNLGEPDGLCHKPSFLWPRSSFYFILSPPDESHVHFMGWCSPGCVKCTVAVDNVMENECLSNTYFTFPTHFEVCPSQSPDKIGVSGIIAAVFIGSLVGLGVMATFYLCFKNSSRKAAHYRILTPSVQSH
eukprot:m.93923 g.93923  ORF g.93923 m.93923 type:complete len:348 (-) comp8920_c0_seq4:5373-6416(-)